MIPHTQQHVPPEVRYDQFHAFGIPAYPTKATREDICRDFVLIGRWCPWGNRCHRIHPLNKVMYQQKKIDKARRKSSDPLAGVRGATIKLQESDSKLDREPVLEAHAPLTPDINEKTARSEGPDGDGWDPAGSWMLNTKPESWSSPATSANDQFFSNSSGSSSPTTADSDDGSLEDFPIVPRTGICVLFKRNGTCSNDNCPFRHIPALVELSSKQSEEKTIEATTPPETPIPSVSTTPAQTTASSEAQALQIPQARHPRPKTNEVCRRWLRNVCAYGYNCRWIHNDLDYDDEPGNQSLKSSGSVSSPAAPKYPGSTDDFLLSFTLHDHMRVQCSAGFEVQRIQTAFESSTLLVSNISSRVRPNDLRDTLSSYGIVEDLQMPPILSKDKVVRVTYSDAAEAQKAQKALHRIKMCDTTISAQVASGGGMKTVTNVILKDTSIRISWERPTKEVFAGFSNMEQAKRALRIARENPLNGNYLKGTIYEGMPAVDVVNVRFCGVPAGADKADLVRFVNPVDIMWTRPNYKEEEAGVIESYIRNFLVDFSPESFEIMPPPYRDGGMVRAWANFGTSTKAKEAAHRLNGRKPRYENRTLTSIWARHVRHISYSLTPEKFTRHGAAIESLRIAQVGRLTSVIVSPHSNGRADVRLSGDDQKELAHLKNQFEKILKGEIVRCDGKVVYDSYFTREEGSTFLQDLKTKNPAVYFENNSTQQCIRLFGYPTDRVRFANAIVAKVKEFRSQMKFEIPLAYGLLGAAIKNPVLKELQQKYGQDNAHIDVYKRVFRVRGDFGLYQRFKNVVDDMEKRLPRSTAYRGPTCPICFDEPSMPIHLQCGHVWCRGCISHYFRSAREQRSFPLKCLGNGGRCNTKMPIRIAKETLPEPEFRAIVDAAFLSYINARPKDFHFCPTPDCPQVYRSTLEKAELQCPSCLTSICTRCHSEGHDKLQCADQVQDELFKKWIKEHDVKECPTCNATIEKIEGCNHMTCTRCQTHICWQCMKTFTGGEGIYGHMREVHGTFGLAQVFD